MFYFLADAMDFGGVAAIVFEGPLGYYLSAVQVGVYIMDADAEDLDSVGHRILHRMRALERRQQ